MKKNYANKNLMFFKLSDLFKNTDIQKNPQISFYIRGNICMMSVLANFLANTSNHHKTL